MDEEVEVPIFRQTKGGGKRVIELKKAKVIYRGPRFITVLLDKYPVTYMLDELQLQVGERNQPYKKSNSNNPPAPRKRRRRKS